MIGLAGVGDLRAADQAVGGLQRDGADHAVADVLGDLEDDRLLLAAELELGRQLVVDLGHRVGRELDVHDRADDAGDAADASRRPGSVVSSTVAVIVSLTPGVVRRQGR